MAVPLKKDGMDDGLIDTPAKENEEMDLHCTHDGKELIISPVFNMTILYNFGMNKDGQKFIVGSGFKCLGRNC